jgi:hypothetical protein
MHDGTPTQVEIALMLARRQKIKDDAFAQEVNRRGAEILDEIREQKAYAQELLRGLEIEEKRFAHYGRGQPPTQQPTQQNFPREQPPMQLAAKREAAAE